MKISVHKVVLCIVDFDEVESKDIIQVIENTKYPNHCIGPKVSKIESREVDWSDEHPLNQKNQWSNAFENLFKDTEGPELE